jgi:ribosomal protein L21
MTYIIESGSKQYVVEPGQKIIVDRLKNIAEGAVIPLHFIYAFGEHASATELSATVVAHQRGVKIRVTKYLPKSNYHRQYGPRAEETVLQIAGGEKKEKKEVKKVAAPIKNKATTKETPPPAPKKPRAKKAE